MSASRSESGEQCGRGGGFPMGPLFGLRISPLVVAIKAGQCGHDVSAQQLPVQ